MANVTEAPIESARPVRNEAEKVKHLAVGSEERRRRFDEIADRIVREDHELLVELAKR